MAPLSAASLRVAAVTRLDLCGAPKNMSVTKGLEMTNCSSLSGLFSDILVKTQDGLLTHTHPVQYLQQGGGEGSAIGRSVCLAEAAWAPPSASVRRPRNLGLSAVHLRTEIAFGSDSFAGAAAAAALSAQFGIMKHQLEWKGDMRRRRTRARRASSKLRLNQAGSV